MEFVSSAPQRKNVGRGTRAANVLSMYDSQPEFNKISLDQFAEIGLDRIRVLQKFDEVSGKTELTDVERNAELSAAVKKYLRSKPQRMVKSPLLDDGQLVLDSKTKDSLSHFIVRLAYCRSTDLRSWLLTQEVALFAWRFQHSLLSSEQAEFVRSCGDLGDDCQVVSKEEFNELRNDLYVACRVSEANAPTADSFYKVTFEHVTDLLRRRQVLMRDGFAFLHRSHVVGMLSGLFRTKLNKSLTLLARKWPSFSRMESDRLLPIVSQLSADR